MNWRPELRRRLAPLELSPAREAEIVDELAAHLDDRYREHLAAGRSEKDARRLALEELTAEDALARRLAVVEAQAPIDPPVPGQPSRSRLFHGLRQDARYGLRTLRKNPGFACVAILMMALGTGANAAMFSVVDAVLLRVPYRDPSRVVILQNRADQRTTMLNAKADRVRELQGTTQVFDAVTGLGSGNPIAAELSEPRRLQIECGHASMFRVLGIDPVRGRAFGEADDLPGADPVIVVGYRFWQRDLGGAADAVGRTIRLNGSLVTVVGVMPPELDSFRSVGVRDGWAPLGRALAGGGPIDCRASQGMNVYARIRSDLNIESAEARIAALTQGTIGLLPIASVSVEESRTMLITLLGAVAFVLPIACANLANLLIERAIGRSREIAVRRALGASPGRLMRQVLTESVLVCGLGALAGVVVASLLLDTLVALMPTNIPRVSRIDMNMRVLIATMLVSATAGLLAGLLPAIQVGARVVNALNDARAATASGRQWIRRTLVGAELALAVALVIGAGLMLSTFLTLRPSNPGFDPSNRLRALASLTGPRYQAEAPRRVFMDQLFDRLRTLPGVVEVSGACYAPMSNHICDAAVIIAERPETADGKTRIFTPVVTANYFAAMAMPIKAGRAFTNADDMGAEPVAVVNETMARRFWPGRAPVGLTLTVNRGDRVGPAGGPTLRRIVGVVADTRTFGSDTRTRAEVFVPFAQSPSWIMDLIIRTDGAASPGLPAAIRAEAAKVDASQTIDRIESMDEVLARSTAPWRFVTVLLTIFAVMGVGLAVVGLAATMAWTVTRRTREIGVRLALGARPSAIVGMMLRQALALSVAGVVAGLGTAALTTRLLSGWLYGVTPLDGATFAACAALMLVVALVASYVPARRATRVDPLTALRSE